MTPHAPPNPGDQPRGSTARSGRLPAARRRRDTQPLPAPIPPGGVDGRTLTQHSPHLLVVLHEAADALALNLPLGFLQLLPQLLLSVLPIAVLFFPAIEAPHWVGSRFTSLTHRVTATAKSRTDSKLQNPAEARY